MTGLPIDRDIPIGSRVSQRIKTEERATIYFENTFFEVTVLDLGLEGFGILSARMLKEESEVALDIPEDIGVARYTCNVSFCETKEDGFHIGLKIIESEDEIVLLTEL
ncbi:MAG: PilZ domain-containing protein [Magnetococcales bacterium]|nr:PilZ domain-containing protein [Magnetococcales bacterium]